LPPLTPHLPTALLAPLPSNPRYVAGALPHNPLVTHETDPRHLRDPSFLGAALRHRAARLLFTLQTRIRGLRGSLGERRAGARPGPEPMVVLRTGLERMEGVVSGTTPFQKHPWPLTSTCSPCPPQATSRRGTRA
jgi:hypothetical protein